MYQCAETDSMAFGLGISAPIAAHPSVHTLCSSAFMGLPCPKKTAGMGFAGFFTFSSAFQIDKCLALL